MQEGAQHCSTLRCHCAARHLHAAEELCGAAFEFFCAPANSRHGLRDGLSAAACCMALAREPPAILTPTKTTRPPSACCATSVWRTSHMAAAPSSASTFALLGGGAFIALFTRRLHKHANFSCLRDVLRQAANAARAAGRRRRCGKTADDGVRLAGLRGGKTATPSHHLQYLFLPPRVFSVNPWREN